MDIIPPPLPRSLEKPQEEDSDTGATEHNFTTDDEDDNMSDVESRTPQERLEAALVSRSEGNAKLTSGDCEGALTSYRDGLKALKNVEFSSETEVEKNAQLRSVNLALHLNSALALSKLERWGDAAESAGKALKIDSKSVKGFFRRGIARSHLGMLDEARADLMTVLSQEPANAEARKELESVKRKVAASRAAERAAFGSLFAKGRGLYDDREKQVQEEKRKAAEAEKERRGEWEREMKKRKINGEEELTYDNWKKEKEAKAKREEELKRSKAKQQPQKPRESRPKASTDDTVELDEEDLKIVDETKKMGYCYFRTEIDEETKAKLREANKPQELTPTPSATPSDTVGSSNSRAKNALSEWNQEGGTYEEKDVSKWAVHAAKLHFERMEIARPAVEGAEGLVQALINCGIAEEQVMEAMARDALVSVTFKVTKADVSGGAEIVVVRGTRRFLYDFTVKLDWECVVPGAEDLGVIAEMMEKSGGKFGLEKEATKLTGRLELHDVDSAGTTSGEWASTARLRPTTSVDAWQKNTLVRALFEQVSNRLRETLLATAKAFEEEYRTVHQ